MNRAQVKNQLLKTASLSAPVTEPVPITNPNLNRSRNSRFQSTSAALKPGLITKKTMFPDSS